MYYYFVEMASRHIDLMKRKTFGLLIFFFIRLCKYLYRIDIFDLSISKKKDYILCKYDVHIRYLYFAEKYIAQD